MTLPPDYYEEYLENSGDESPMQGLLGALALQFAASCVIMPFEVTKTILQVQCADIAASVEEKVEENDLDSKLRQYDRYLKSGSSSSTSIHKSDTDAAGYLSMGKISSLQLPILRGGFWNSLKNISSHQGFPSLFTGVSIHWIHSMCHQSLSAAAENSIVSFLESQRIISAVEDSWKVDLSILSACRILSGVILSPLELIRTRYICQSVLGNEKKYRNVFSTCKTLIREEGFSGLFGNIGLTVFYYALDPLFKFIPSVLLSRYLETDDVSATRTLLHVLLNFVSGSVLLLVKLPLETIRKRLQFQQNIKPLIARSNLFPLIPRMRVSQKEYTGVWNCFIRIIREEGVGALYKGVGLHMIINGCSSMTTLLGIWVESDLEEESIY